MAINSFGTFLMHKDTDAWKKLIDIKTLPDLEGAPEQLDTTTLSDPRKTSILGILESDVLEFTCNFVKEDYARLKGMSNKQMEFAVWLGASDAEGKTPDGHEGIWEMSGMLSVSKTGAEVNGVQEMTVSIAVSELEYKESSTPVG